MMLCFADDDGNINPYATFNQIGGNKDDKTSSDQSHTISSEEDVVALEKAAAQQKVRQNCRRYNQ